MVAAEPFSLLHVNMCLCVCFLQVYAEDCCDPCFLELQNHLPKYYGTWSPPDSPNGETMNFFDKAHSHSCPTASRSQVRPPSLWLFCVELACSPCVCVGSFQMIAMMHVIIEYHKYWDIKVKCCWCVWLGLSYYCLFMFIS